MVGELLEPCCCSFRGSCSPPALDCTDLFLSGSTPAPRTELLTRGLEFLLQPPAGPAFTRDSGQGKLPQPQPSVRSPEVLELGVDQFGA